MTSAPPLRICLVGGIYGKTAEYRSMVSITPETTLEQGLRSRGHLVVPFSHNAPVDESQFDVVHVHHLGAGAARAALRCSPRPLVITLHDARAAQGSLSFFKSTQARLILSRVDAVVGLSQWECARLQQTFGLRNAPAVIPNGIDAELFKFVGPSERPRHAGWKLAYVGQLVEIKRVDLLLKAMASLPVNIELSLAYQVDCLKDKLRKLSKALGIASRVHFLGTRSPRELAHLYQTSDALVLPSASEALPSVIPEAMLCGTPVIATRVGGIPEQMSRFGILVPPKSAEALAQAITTLLDNYARFAADALDMSRYARQCASISVMIEKHVELYRELLSTECAARRQAALPLATGWLSRKALDCVCQMKCRLSSTPTPGHPRPTGDTSN